MFDLDKLSSIKIGLASPEAIRSWSYAERHGPKPGAGEVTKPETINYRTQKPEPEGLFCEKIFGPFKDFECHCGKYKKTRFQGVVCEKCGVEVTSKAVRRERMGYINLAAPCAHIWYTKGTPSKMALLLDIPPKDLEEVIYFTSHIVLNPGSCPHLTYKQVLDEREGREVFTTILSGFLQDGVVTPDQPREFERLQRYLDSLGNQSEPYDFQSIANFINIYTGAQFGWGAAAAKQLLDEIKIEEEFNRINAQLRDPKDHSSQKRLKLIKRLEVVESIRNSDNKASWMILDVIPVIPPDLRPMLMLDGGRFATSDLNDLYRRVIIRNSRLAKLIKMKAPSVIQVNEMRMLQEAVDALIDNGRRNKPVTGVSGRPLKSLSSALKGKQGRFRQNLLGKRVDYSGRSVICVGPFLRMDQCGLPREMAINLFKPFLIQELIKEGLARSTKQAEYMVACFDDCVFDALEKIVPNHPVLLNRAPTLHRLGIQAFRPVLVDGHAIRLHPLVCPGFNADFDGDQMAVHVPLSREAQQEAFDLMIATRNILSPRDATVLAIPVQDVVVGHFYLTSEQTPDESREQIAELRLIRERIPASEQYRKDVLDRYIATLEGYVDYDGHAFRDYDEVMRALERKIISKNTRIVMPAASLHKENYFTPEQQQRLIVTTPGKLIFNNMFPADFPFINDSPKHCKNIFKAAPDSWFVPAGVDPRKYLEKWEPTEPIAKGQLATIINELCRRYGSRRTAILLDRIKDTGYEECTRMGLTLSITDINDLPGKEKYLKQGDDAVREIEESYEDGLITQNQRHDQIVGAWNRAKADMTADIDKYMRAHPRNPVFMMARSGARGSLNNFVQLIGMRGPMSGPNNVTIEIPVRNSFRQGMTVSEYFIATHGARKGSTDTALKTADSGYLTRRLVDVSHSVVIRMPDCGVDHGMKVRPICDEGGNQLVSVGTRVLGRYAAVDVVAPDGTVICRRNEFLDEAKAHQIDELGLKEVEVRSLLTCRAKEGVCIKCYGRNMATGEMARMGDTVGIMAAQSIGEPGTQPTMRTFHEGGVAGSDITQGLPRVQELLEVRNPKGQATIATIGGRITSIEPEEKKDSSGTRSRQTGRIVFTIQNDLEEQKVISHTINPKQIVKVGDTVSAGQALTAGSTDPKELLDDTDTWEAARYVIDEVQKVYNAQGINISDKHIEVIVRQMIGKIAIIDGGDTDLLPGIRTDTLTFTEKNQKAFEHGGRPAVGRPMILGVTKAALDTDSFLSSASFQETTRVLTDSALKGKVDYLKGLKENVIIGKLIPAGTGGGVRGGLRRPQVRLHRFGVLHRRPARGGAPHHRYRGSGQARDRRWRVHFWLLVLTSAIETPLTRGFYRILNSRFIGQSSVLKGKLCLIHERITHSAVVKSHFSRRDSSVARVLLPSISRANLTGDSNCGRKL